MKVYRNSQRVLSTRHLPAACFALILSLFLANPAWAGLCGDDLEGGRVACSCGDIVSTDTQLRADDPVVNTRCSTDGLFLRAPRGAASITLDLNGLSIVGKGIGTGVRVVDGGDNGATILGSRDGRRAQIVGFRNGLHAHGKRDLAVLRDVEVMANASDGVVVRSSGAQLSGVRAVDNGRDGLRLRGHGSSYSRISAEGNQGSGVRIGGSDTQLNGRMSGNGRHGVQLSGEGHTLVGAVSEDNAGTGLFATGRKHEVQNSTIEGNVAGEIAGPAAAIIGGAK